MKFRGSFSCFGFLFKSCCCCCCCCYKEILSHNHALNPSSFTSFERQCELVPYGSIDGMEMGFANLVTRGLLKNDENGRLK